MKPFTLVSRFSLGLLGLASASLVLAGPSPQVGTFSVSATVAKSCNITSTGNVAFGAYDPNDTHLSTPLDATGGVTVRCTKGVAYAVALDQGATAAAGSSADAPLRQMTDGGTERIRYDLYSDASHTTVWGGTAASDVNNTETTGPSSPDTLTVYGRIPAGQNAAEGSYTDTVNVTVTF